jgi:hypothetical protein
MILISTPSFTAKHAADWCSAAGPLIDWVRAVADFLGAKARAERRAEEEAAAEAEAAARAALEALHKAQALAGRRLEEQVWDEDVAEEQFDPLALVALKADVVSARSRAVARIALHCIALHCIERFESLT